MKKTKLRINGILFASFFLAGANNLIGQCAIPTSVTATPSVICSGATASLNAISVGNSIAWYTVPVGGVSLGSSASGANFTLSPTTNTYYAESFSAGTTTLSYTGNLQTYTVPAGITQVTIDARGGQGGNSPGNTALGGSGARMIGTFTVTPGQVLNILVGQQGNTKPNDNGSNYGGGGGGGSFVWTSSVNPMIAAGGGGGAQNANPGGQGLTSVAGGTSNNGANGGNLGNGGFAAAGQWCDGAGGGGWFTGGGNSGCGGYAPQLQGGGTYSTFVAGLCTAPCNAGGTNYGTSGGYGGGAACWHGGGGGGGYSGGGGGDNSVGCGGGGGSYNAGTNQSNTSGFQTGNGLVMISFNSCVSASRTAVMLTVNATPTIAVNSGTICAGNAFTIVPTGANTYTIQGGNAVVSPTANANYTVVGTSSAGCVSQTYATAGVTVNASPLPTIAVNSGSVCAGNAFTIVPSGANTYTIQGGNAVVSPTANASYTVVGTNTAGCNSATFATSSITVAALPSVSVAGAGTICVGNSTVLTASGANSYSWNTGATTSTISVSPTVSATYTAIGTNTAGCANSVTASIVVSPCTGINQFGVQASDFKVYPNPSNGEFTVELKNGLNKSIEVTDLTGKVVFTNSTSKDKVNINIGHLPNGIYHVKIQSNNAVEVLKIVKQ